MDERSSTEMTASHVSLPPEPALPVGEIHRNCKEPTRSWQNANLHSHRCFGWIRHTNWFMRINPQLSLSTRISQMRMIAGDVDWDTGPIHSGAIGTPLFLRLEHLPTIGIHVSDITTRLRITPQHIPDRRLKPVCIPQRN